MPLHLRGATPLLRRSVLEPNYTYVMSLRSLFLASVAVLAGCSRVDVAPAPATVVVVRPEAPNATVVMKVAAPAPPCRSNDDCGVNTGGLCMPKPVTKELSDAEDFLDRAMSLDSLITRLGDKSRSSPTMTILERMQQDLSMYGQIAQGHVPPGVDATGATAVAQGAPPTGAQMQDAAWMQSGVTQADMIVRRFLFALSRSPITTDAQKVHADITGDSGGLHLDEITSDLQAFLHDIDVVVAPINKLVGYRAPDGSAPGPQTGAGAVTRYFGPVLKEINDATSSVSASLDPSAASQLTNDVSVFSQAHGLLGKDGNGGTCLGSR